MTESVLPGKNNNVHIICIYIYAAEVGERSDLDNN